MTVSELFVVACGRGWPKREWLRHQVFAPLACALSTERTAEAGESAAEYFRDRNVLFLRSLCLPAPSSAPTPLILGRFPAPNNGSPAPATASRDPSAFGESQGWKCGLENKPWEAVGFYCVIIAATILGIGIDFSSLDPIKALFWSAVINGFVAVPVMAAMMWVGSQRDQMGRFTVAPLTLTLGWATTAVMAAAAIAMLLF
jgi:hypothetical protein